jgi:serine phosphatase RsbU (regulator of sigma subunit)
LKPDRFVWPAEPERFIVLDWSGSGGGRRGGGLSVEFVPSRSNPLARLLRAQQETEPDALVEALTTAVASIRAHDLVVYLVDYEHSELLPHPDSLPHGEQPEPASVDGSMAGRAFTTGQCQAVERADGWRAWVPVQERANRLGVLAITLPDWNDELDQFCIELGFAAANLLMASANYTDVAHTLRRAKRMDLAAEMQWGLLPPLSFSVNGTALSALVEPAYEVGGDAFDYAYNGGVLEFAIFDAVGHGLRSASLAGLVVGAYRHGRRLRHTLGQLAAGMDNAARVFPHQAAFVTAVLGRLQVETGVLSWITCGHPQPVVVRESSCMPADSTVRPGLPAGLGSHGSVVGTEQQISLEPGDGVLLYSDGAVEARNGAGEPFGEERLRDLLAREHRANGQPQEVVRRLVRATIEHSGDRLSDDATLIYLRWDGPAAPT